LVIENGGKNIIRYIHIDLYAISHRLQRPLCLISTPKSGPKDTAIFQGVRMSGKELGHEEIAVYRGTNYFCPPTGGIRHSGGRGLP
jgi:hypothetical protein